MNEQGVCPKCLLSTTHIYSFGVIFKCSSQQQQMNALTDITGANVSPLSFGLHCYYIIFICKLQYFSQFFIYEILGVSCNIVITIHGSIYYYMYVQREKLMTRSLSIELNSHSSLQLMSGSLLNGNVTYYSARVVGLNITIEYLVLNGVIHGQQVHAAQTMHAHYPLASATR